MHKVKLIFGLFLILTFSIQDGLAKDTVLVLLTDTKNFSLVLEAIKDDIGDEIDIQDLIIDRNTSVTNIDKKIKAVTPKLMVLIGNMAISKYSDYQEENKAQRKSFPPSLALSAIYLDKVIDQVTNATGIRNEIPIVTSIVNIRDIMRTPVDRVGVLYSAWMENLIEINRVFCALEEVELVTVQLPNQVGYKQLRYHLRQLVEQDIDALWIPNDNLLLNARLIQNAWMPVLKKAKMPVIVGIEELTVTALNFGTFSVTPDFYALGMQGAQMISNIGEENWTIEEDGLVEPISIEKLLNLKLSLRKEIPIDINKLGAIDRIIR